MTSRRPQVFDVTQFIYGRVWPEEDKGEVELLLMLISHICGGFEMLRFEQFECHLLAWRGAFCVVHGCFVVMHALSVLNLVVLRAFSAGVRPKVRCRLHVATSQIFKTHLPPASQQASAQSSGSPGAAAADCS